MAEGGGASADGVSLPSDALFEILSRTPATSVCRFRCVSKEWQALISDPAIVSQLEPLLVVSYCGKKPSTDSSIVVMDMEGNIMRKIKGLGVHAAFCSTLGDLICVTCSSDVTRVLDVTTGKDIVAPFQKPVGNFKHHVIRLGRAAVSGSCKAVRIVELHPSDGVQPPQTCQVLTFGGN
jgi:hypothetical protein